MAQQKPYPLRIPDDLREALEHMAKDEGRSLNKEIEERLEASLSQDADRKRILQELDELKTLIKSLHEKLDKK